MAAPALDPSRTGFVLYVSLPDGQDPADLTDVAEIVREIAVDLLPGAETVTALSLAPGGSGDVRTVGARLNHLRLIAGDDVLATSGDGG